jgi:hypothetical protein
VIDTTYGGRGRLAPGGSFGTDLVRAANIDAENAMYRAACADVNAATGWDLAADVANTSPSGGILGRINGEPAALYLTPPRFGRPATVAWSAWRGLGGRKVRATGATAVECAINLRAAITVAA